jgi:hypothetical protein
MSGGLGPRTRGGGAERAPAHGAAMLRVGAGGSVAPSRRGGPGV